MPILLHQSLDWLNDSGIVLDACHETKKGRRSYGILGIYLEFEARKVCSNNNSVQQYRLL